MKKEPLAFSFLIDNELTPKKDKEKGKSAILNFLILTGLTIKEIEAFSKAARKNDVLIKKIKNIMKEAERSSYP